MNLADVAAVESMPSAAAQGTVQASTNAPPLPRFLQIEPVGQCNLRCRMCAIQFRPDGSPHGPLAFMAFEDFTTLLDQFPDLDELHLQGLGEPMMHPRFFDMVAHAAVRGIKVSTNTNLSLLSERRAKECVASGLSSIHVSLDGATAQVYEAIRVRGRFDRVLRNLDRLLAARLSRGGSLPYIRIVVVAMRKNLHELPAIVRLARAHGVDEIFVQHLCHDFSEDALPAHYRPMRDYVEQESLTHESPAIIRQIFDAARAAARTIGVTLRLPPIDREPQSSKPQPREPQSRESQSPEPQLSKPTAGEAPTTLSTASAAHSSKKAAARRCDWPWRGAYVSYDGLAMPCCMVGTPDRINFGNMNDQGVAAIWNNQAFAQFRDALDSDRPHALCRGCSVFRGTF